MRASDADQLHGLDISEHDAAGYPDFAPALTMFEAEDEAPLVGTL